MQSLPLIIQVLLIVGWYAIPAMASLPVWVVFLPTIISVSILTVVLVAIVAMGILKAVIDR